MNSYSNTKGNTYFVEISLEQIIRNTSFLYKWHSIRRHKIHQKLPLLFWLAAGPHERWLCNSAGSVLRVLWITPAGTVENLVKQLRLLAFHRKWENTTTEKMGKYRNIWHMWGIGKQRWWKRGRDMITRLSYLYYVWLHGLFNLFLVEADVSLIGKGSSKKQHPTILFNCNFLQQAWAQDKVHPTKTD